MRIQIRQFMVWRGRSSGRDDRATPFERSRLTPETWMRPIPSGISGRSSSQMLNQNAVFQRFCAGEPARPCLQPRQRRPPLESAMQFTYFYSASSVKTDLRKEGAPFLLVVKPFNAKRCPDRVVGHSHVLPPRPDAYSQWHDRRSRSVASTFNCHPRAGRSTQAGSQTTETRPRSRWERAPHRRDLISRTQISR